MVLAVVASMSSSRLAVMTGSVTEIMMWLKNDLWSKVHKLCMALNFVFFCSKSQHTDVSTRAIPEILKAKQEMGTKLWDETWENNYSCESNEEEKTSQQPRCKAMVDTLPSNSLEGAWE